jgi:hypothetical protein
LIEHEDEQWERPSAPKTKFKKQAKRFLGFIDEDDLEAFLDEDDEFDQFERLRSKRGRLK